MRTILLVLLTCFYIFKAQAESEPPELKFLKGVKPYVTPYSKFPNSKVPRPLNEFMAGKKYCLHGSKTWDDTCQDTAMKYAYGQRWREFKQVALEFVRFANSDDIDGIIKLLRFPFGILYSHDGPEANEYYEDIVN